MIAPPPLYKECQKLASAPSDGHKGLWFDRYFNQYDGPPNWKVKEGGKKEWIDKVTGPCGNHDQLTTACHLQENLCHALDGIVEEFKTNWHFSTGLGNPHPVENGFAWHPTLGVPYMTGAAVKGLVRAWVECWMDFEGTDDNELNKRQDTLYRWFGNDTEAGLFIFFDAIPTERVKLICDVMTPHYGSWYEQGGEIQSVVDQPDVVPADWHSPIPIPFLVAKDASLLFCIAPRRKTKTETEKTAIEAELAKVMKALTDSLEHLGAGAKTAAGYGRFEVNEAARSKREQAAHRARLQELSPEERLREEILQLGEEQLAKMFGKNFKSTQEKKGDDWDTFVLLVKEIHGEKIQSWRSSPNKNMKKTFSKLFG